MKDLSPAASYFFVMLQALCIGSLAHAKALT